MEEKSQDEDIDRNIYEDNIRGMWNENWKEEEKMEEWKKLDMGGIKE